MKPAPNASHVSLDDSSALRRLFGSYPTGVAAICALRNDVPAGIVATSFIPVSLDPALVSICVQHTSTTWPQLSRESHVGVSIMASTQAAICRQIAAKNQDRFAGVSWHATGNGSVLLQHAAAWLDCEITATIPAGDHDVVLLEVTDAAISPQVSPLVFHDSRFRFLSDSEHP